MTRKSGPAKAASPQTPGERSDTSKDTPRGTRVRNVPNLPRRPDESYWRQLLKDADRGELVEVVE